MQNMSKLYYTFADLENDLHDINQQMVMDRYTPDVIIGPGRGAYILGVMLSHYWNKPFEAFTWQTRDGSQKNENNLREILNKHVHSNILLVDDINDTGKTLTEIINIMNDEVGFADFRTATLFSKTQSQFKNVDFYARELTPDYDPWIVFPYEEWWK
jgi:hypoxanthine phosphoribosyltransferase